MISILDNVFKIITYGIFWIWIICIPISILAYIAFLIIAKIMWKKEVKKYSDEQNRNKGFLGRKLECEWDKRIKERKDDYCYAKISWCMYILISFLPYYNVLLLGALIVKIIESIEGSH